jgi:chromosome segregation ATPase
MTESPEKARTIEDIEQERASVSAKRERMEAELQEQEQPLSWEMAKKPGTLKKLAEAAQKRTHYPRILRACRERELELQREALERRAGDERSKMEVAHRELEAAEAKRLEAEEEERAARAAYSHPYTRLQKLERNIKDFERQLAELRGEER